MDATRSGCLAVVVAITVYLADDSVLIREGVRAMLERDRDVEVVGVAEDYDSLVAGAEAAHPDVVVTDIRMPPNFQREGIDAAKEIRKRHPGTGVVILSQFDDPDYAVALLSEGSAGYAYLLKDRIAEGDQLARAIREVATGGSMLDPVIVAALMNPVRRTGGLTPRTTSCSTQVAAGRTIKAIAMADQVDARRGRGQRRAAVRRHSPPACRPARRARSSASAVCTRPSSSAKSRARH